jgi:hypothetical protein
MDAFPSLPSSIGRKNGPSPRPSSGREEDNADTDSALAAAAAIAESAVAGLDMLDLNDPVYEPNTNKGQGGGRLDILPSSQTQTQQTSKQSVWHQLSAPANLTRNKFDAGSKPAANGPSGKSSSNPSSMVQQTNPTPTGALPGLHKTHNDSLSLSMTSYKTFVHLRTLFFVENDSILVFDYL